MTKAWFAFAAALTIGAAALTMSTPAQAQCAAPVVAASGCCGGSYEPRGLFTGGFGCGGGYGYNGCGGGCGCSGAGTYQHGYSYGHGYGGGYYGHGYGGGYYGGGYYGGGYYRPHVTAFGVARRHARRVYRRSHWY